MKRFVIMIIAVIAVAVLWMAGWFYVAGIVRDEIGALALADGVSQPRLTCEGLNVGGAPFSFSPHCTEARITSGDISVSVPEISGTALFYRPFHIQVFVTGPAYVTDAFTGASQKLDWSNLHASLRIEDGTIGRFSALADDLVYSDTLMGDEQLATAVHGEIHLLDSTPGDAAPGTGQVYDFYASFEDLDSARLDLANAALSVDGRLTGVPDSALWGDPDLVAFWQAYGGQLALRGLDLEAGELAFNATGEASLDSSGLLNANAEITSRGVTGRIARLIGDPAVAQIVLGGPDAEGVSRQKLTVTEGQMVVGIMPIMTVPPLF